MRIEHVTPERAAGPIRAASSLAGERDSLVVRLAADSEEIRQALALRHQVFAEEQGANVGAPDGLDCDDYDAYCDHLIVLNEATTQVVGTYRILPPDQARNTAGYYAEREFDLSAFRRQRIPLAEAGRACVHASYRGGSTLMMLWSGLACHMDERGLETMIGCASIGLDDGGANATAIYRKLALSAMTDPPLRAIPKNPLPPYPLERCGEPMLPPLLRGYLALGARIAGPPAFDPEFRTADFLVLLRLPQLPARYARHFLRQPTGRRS